MNKTPARGLKVAVLTAEGGTAEQAGIKLGKAINDWLEANPSAEIHERNFTTGERHGSLVHTVILWYSPGFGT